MATGNEWIYPVSWCPVCKHPFRDRAQEIIHRLEQRHWGRRDKQIISISPPPPDPTGAAKLKAALKAAERRRQGEWTDLTSDHHEPKSDGAQEDEDADPLSV
jgi:hypothetical protein